MKIITIFYAIIFGTILANAQTQPAIIPQPQIYKATGGNFILDSRTKIIEYGIGFEAEYLRAAVAKAVMPLTTHRGETTNIYLEILPIDAKIPDVNAVQERYFLTITPTEIRLKAYTHQGLFWGVQTIVQMLSSSNAQSSVVLPCFNIEDAPKFAWRGVHLDVCRHFFPTAFIKKYIDYLARYKMNVFHWHLTEDQGWRIEIKKHPKLTDVGAWRNGSMLGHYNENRFDSLRYGGFYTQAEIKEIVDYAQARHITIVPEIEMPGHALAALSAYPELACSGNKFEVGQKWGVFDDVFCPSETTFTFLEDVLTEVIALFPSPYIHIGGDECPKTRWRESPLCQQIIKEKGLKDEHELQSYFIQRIEKFVNAKGRKIIGWDEILEGGLAPNAAVMSWRGTEGGIAAASQGHNVVMSPGSHCYFDHYQGSPKNEPVAIGGYTPLEKVYAYDPIPTTLATDKHRFILGAQANMWTEYMTTEKQVEYMLFPRLLALSEVVWGTAKTANYEAFKRDVISHFDYFDKNNINYSKAIFEVKAKISPNAKGGVAVALTSGSDTTGIRYSIDKKAMQIYQKPFLITTNQTISAARYDKNNKQVSALLEQSFSINKATGKTITLKNLPHQNYAHGGAFTLINGVEGNKNIFTNDWLGWSGADLEAEIDLSATQKIKYLQTNFLRNEGSWIYLPSEVEVWIADKKHEFKRVASLTKADIDRNNGALHLDFPIQKARFIKIIAKNSGKIPEGKPGAGSNAWLFCDEIAVE